MFRTKYVIFWAQKIWQIEILSLVTVSWFCHFVSSIFLLRAKYNIFHPEILHIGRVHHCLERPCIVRHVNNCIFGRYVFHIIKRYALKFVSCNAAFWIKNLMLLIATHITLFSQHDLTYFILTCLIQAPGETTSPNYFDS
jgi:hypothetical protein